MGQDHTLRQLFQHRCSDDSYDERQASFRSAGAVTYKLPLPVTLHNRIHTDVNFHLPLPLANEGENDEEVLKLKDRSQCLTTSYSARPTRLNSLRCPPAPSIVAGTCLENKLRKRVGITRESQVVTEVANQNIEKEITQGKSFGLKRR